MNRLVDEAAGRAVGRPLGIELGPGRRHDGRHSEVARALQDVGAAPILERGIQDEQPDGTAGESDDPLGAGAGDESLMTLVPEHRYQGLGTRGVVVHDKNAGLTPRSKAQRATLSA